MFSPGFVMLLFVFFLKFINHLAAEERTCFFYSLSIIWLLKRASFSIVCQ